MSYERPDALAMNLAQPMARICAVFENAGFRCYGLGRTPLRGPNGLEGLCHALHRKPDTVQTPTSRVCRGSRSCSVSPTQRTALICCLRRRTRQSITICDGWPVAGWDWYGALPMGRVTDHAEFLPAQPNHIPEEDPQFGETVEQRKELHSVHEYRGRSWRGCA